MFSVDISVWFIVLRAILCVVGGCAASLASVQQMLIALLSPSPVMRVKNVSRLCQMSPGRQSILCLRTTGSYKINKLSIPQICKPGSWLEGGDSKTPRVYRWRGLLSGERKHTSWDVCLFRLRGLTYLGTLLNRAADDRLRAHYPPIACLSLLIRRAFIRNLFLVYALFEENSE